jgi:hypothetical protein
MCKLDLSFLRNREGRLCQRKTEKEMMRVMIFKVSLTKEQNDYDEGDDIGNEDNDVLEEEERNDDGEGDDDFVPILTDGWDIGEDYYDSADEDDDPDYDPHEYIERRLIVNRSEKHHLVRDFSDISEIN